VLVGYGGEVEVVVRAGVHFGMLVHVSSCPTNVHTEQMLDSVVTMVWIGGGMVLLGRVVYAQLFAGVTLVSTDSENVELEQTQ